MFLQRKQPASMPIGSARIKLVDQSNLYESTPTHGHPDRQSSSANHPSPCSASLEIFTQGAAKSKISARASKDLYYIGRKLMKMVILSGDCRAKRCRCSRMGITLVGSSTDDYLFLQRKHFASIAERRKFFKTLNLLTLIERQSSQLVILSEDGNAVEVEGFLFWCGHVQIINLNALRIA